MSVDLKPESGGRWHFVLGPVERWVVGVGAAALIGGCGLFAKSLVDRLDDQNEKLQTVVTQQAVTNGQIQTLSAQLADVPQLTRDMAEIKVRVEQHGQDIRELKQLKGVKP